MADATRTRIDYLPLDAVALAEVNPKRHDDAGIAASVTRFGFVEPIVLDERTTRLVAGHGRLATLKRLRQRAGKTGRAKGGPPAGVVLDGTTWLVPVVRGWSSADDDEAQGYLVASNRLTERGGWDEQALADMLVALDSRSPELVRSAGYTDRELGDLLARLATPVAPPRGGGDPHEAPALTRGRPLSSAGELLQLGPHRLIVGDASDPAVITRLMAGERAACLWTDPPYGVNAVGGDKRLTPEQRKALGGLSIGSDEDPETAAALFASVLAALVTAKALSPGASFYVAHADGPPSLLFRALLSTSPWRYRQTLVWVKDQLVLSRMDHHARHEPIALGEYFPPTEDADVAAEHITPDVLATLAQLIDDLEVPSIDVDGGDQPFSPQGAAAVRVALQALQSLYAPRHVAVAYGHHEGGGRRGRGSAGWYGGNAATTVFEVPRPKASRLHPTMKPLELIAAHLVNSTRPDGIVLDPFGGSGSTMLAAHSLGRRARLVELDPHYADVIARRWQHTSGVVPVVLSGDPANPTRTERTYPALTDAELGGQR